MAYIFKGTEAQQNEDAFHMITETIVVKLGIKLSPFHTS